MKDDAVKSSPGVIVLMFGARREQNGIRAAGKVTQVGVVALGSSSSASLAVVQQSAAPRRPKQDKAPKEQMLDKSLPMLACWIHSG